MAHRTVRSHFLLVLVLSLIGTVICCPGEKCIWRNNGVTVLTKFSSGDSLGQDEDGLPGSEPVRSSGKEYGSRVDDAGSSPVGIAYSWNELLQGFITSLLDRIHKNFGKKHDEIRQIQKTGHGSRMLFVFGDSLFDAGNNVYINTPDYAAANYPYGIAYFTNATGRKSDGRIVPDFIAEYADLPLIPPSLKPKADFSYGANFASAAAAVLDSDDDADYNVVEQFKEMAGALNATLGPVESRKVLSQAVYIFSIGGNDYAYYFTETYDEGYNVTQSDQEQFVKAIVGNTTDALIEIYELGARKIAFQNVGPMGCLPEYESRYTEYNGSCIPLLLSLPLLHNKELYETLMALAAERLQGLKFSVMDYFHALYDRIIDPTKYGFEVGRFPCYNSDDNLGNYTLCEYPSAYVFFDGAHTTQHTNEQIAKLMWDGDPSITRPHTVKQLFEEF